MPRGTNCYRVYDRNIGNLPLAVDMYNDMVHISDYREDPAAPGTGEEDIINTAARMLYVKKEQIRFKTRDVRTGPDQHTKRAETEQLVEIRENNLKFFVNLNDFIDTGLFLDHRKTREMIRETSTGKKVLNLFAYTGSFSVYAAAGGAEKVVTVDLSKTYTAWAQRNFELNGLSGNSYSFINADARDYLSSARSRKEKFDSIILDPPTFSNSRKMDGTFTIQRDYISMIETCLSLLTKEGFILFSTNYKKFHFDKGRIHFGKSHDITASTIDLDFSKKRKPHRCWIIEKGSSEKGKRRH